jgi:hypothetical protein
MLPYRRLWDAPLPKALSSLLVALSVTFLPLWCDQVRARRSAKPIEIVASPAPVIPLSFQAMAELTGTPSDSIAVTVAITNTSTESARTLVGRYCRVLFQWRAASDSNASSRWDGRQRVCLARGHDVSLGPGRTEVLRTTASVRDVLGDSLPDGRYIVTAIFDVDGAAVTRLAGAVVLRRRIR